MPTGQRYSEYDRFAWFYNRYWALEFPRRIIAVVDKLLLSKLAPGASILDLCCGTGQLAQELTARGFRVTGIDSSEAMLRYARENAPAAELILADARWFKLLSLFHGAVSTFDSLNHILNLDELTKAFENVHAALLGDGLFLFDMNMEEAFRTRWQGTFAVVEDDNVCIARGGYNQDEKIARCELTMFRLENEKWQRSDAVVLERCYSEGEVRSALAAAGFGEISVYDAEKDLGMAGNCGRSLFLARKGPA